MTNRFHVALSFPGEHRELVCEVAEELARALTKKRVFYDEWYQHEQVKNWSARRIMAQDGVSSIEKHAQGLPTMPPQCAPDIPLIDVRMKNGHLPSTSNDEGRVLNAGNNYG